MLVSMSGPCLHNLLLLLTSGQRAMVESALLETLSTYDQKTLFPPSHTVVSEGMASGPARLGLSLEEVHSHQLCVLIILCSLYCSNCVHIVLICSCVLCGVSAGRSERRSFG